MASASSSIPKADIESFQAYLAKSTKVLALLGAGLSASSGLPTFRGAGGLWRTHTATTLATPEAFEENPGLVWQFYSYRRHMALQAKPNAGHYALAALAKKMGDGLQTLSQNVDGLSPRAGHPRDTLHLLHGSLYDIKCSGFYCNYNETDNYTDPIVPALEIPLDESDSTTDEALKSRGHSRGQEAEPSQNGDVKPKELDIADESVNIPELSIKDLPHCPVCKTGVLRPGVVWFGELLPSKVMQQVDDFIESNEIDLIMVIGTSASVYPAAGYVDDARYRGARVAVINTDPNDEPESGMMEGDWFFVGDAAQILPELFKPLIGDVSGAAEQISR
ncbi:DHS-like NAD/FAD-binding domain-containing protein [Venturia nashicola]|uniref:DHS-like NAD/FAD-binding domain-containing protein n=1 Tax=Venturia nashicola TaxID=86259 RepID=A0A4Z1P0E6_9PEZI|nr:DHS-like NAD/FAD-binding domain-containing protein [Venturia nashicola]TLD32331.1 DHS-like NAD/FAD-binding domain-containing protein [Venturia nashicola]